MPGHYGKNGMKKKPMNKGAVKPMKKAKKKKK